MGAPQVDAEFAGAEQLQPLPRLAYALLRSPLLPLPGSGQGRLNRRVQHPDAAAAARHLWARLPPADLRCALYPTLSSFSDPDTLARTPAAAPRLLFVETQRGLCIVVRSWACQAMHDNLVRGPAWHTRQELQERPGAASAETHSNPGGASCNLVQQLPGWVCAGEALRPASEWGSLLSASSGACRHTRGTR